MRVRGVEVVGAANFVVFFASIQPREMLVDSFRVDSPNVEYTEEKIESSYEYQTTEMFHEKNADGKYEWVARPRSATYQFATNRKVPKLGYALVVFVSLQEEAPHRSRMACDGDGDDIVGCFCEVL